MKLKAVPGRLIVKIHKNVHEEQIKNGIIVPANEKNAKDIQCWNGTVIDGVSDDIKIGDVVVFGKYAGTDILEDYVSVFIADILGIM